MGEEAGKYWQEIIDGDYDFKRNDKKIEALEKVTRD